MGRVVVGLGNPGPPYENTRHNVGQRVLDVLARRMHVGWDRNGMVIHARGEWEGTAVDLVKPMSFMNVSGAAVSTLLGQIGAGLDDLVLVHDDLDLPLGTVRVRMKGGHGGHNGVRSVLEALGSEEVRRVKVGIGRPADRDDVVDWVLTAFTPEESPLVERAIDEAADRVLALVGTPPPSP